MYPRRILIVDDDPAIVQLVEHWIRRAWPGQVVAFSQATTLREALECLHDPGLEPPIEAIIVDCLLKDSIGLRAPAVLIGAMDPRKPPIPEIVLTGTVQEEEAFNALRRGAQAFLCKSRPDLAQRLPEALRDGWARYQFWNSAFEVLRKQPWGSDD